jgi:hypothetical protein
MMEQSNWELLFGNWEGKLGWEGLSCAWRVEGKCKENDSGQWASVPAWMGGGGLDKGGFHV